MTSGPLLLLLGTVVVLLLGEIALRRAVSRARTLFQWLITEDDDVPALDPERLASFLASSFSPTLGWEPVPGSTGEDRAPGSVTTFAIDDEGARLAPLHAPPPSVAAFGDSYAFCRQVADDQTWASVIGCEAGIGVMNLGVGNYGVDQAMLRYLERRRRLPAGIDTIVAVFVPETIARIRSVWKHWMEFGNTFGFKPRFVLGPEGLVLVPNPVRGPEDYARIEDVVRGIADLDPFRTTRFRRLQFRGSYLVSLIRAPFRHLAILAVVLTGRGLDGRLSRAAFERAFTRVMRGNVREAHLAYRDAEATALLTAVLERFRDEVEADGRRFVVCVIPQLLDLARPRRARRTYGTYFARLGAIMEVVDLTEDLQRHRLPDLYIHDRYGGHLSVLGNEIVARRLAQVLR